MMSILAAVHLCISGELGEPCQRFSDCIAVPWAACMDLKQCACRLGFQLEPTAGKTCLRRHIGSSCTRQEDCKYAVAWSTCYRQRCHCNLGYRVVSDVYQCLPRRIGDRCDSDRDCSYSVSNSACRKHRCRCSHGYIPDRDKRTSCTPWPEPRDVTIIAFCVVGISVCSLFLIFAAIVAVRMLF